MKSSWRVCLVVLGLALALPVLSNAQGPVEMGGGWGQGRGHGSCMGSPMFGMMYHERMKEALGLTDEQSEKLRQIFSESRKSSIRARAELQVKRMELHEIMMGEKTDREAALKKAAEISDLRGQMMRQHVETMLAAKAVLTPEQQKKAHALMAERWSHRGEGFEGHRGMGRGPGGPGGPPHEFPPEPNED